MKQISLLAAAILFLSPLRAAAQIDIPGMKPVPTRPPADAEVIVQETEILPDCEDMKICVEGLLQNIGGKTAKNVKLKIELGGGTHTRPRTSFVSKVENTVMEPGDRQDFSLKIDRKITYKDEKGQEKAIEVGKYNFKIVPVWYKPPELTNRPKKRAK